MQCPECGIALSNELLSYCEECGAKLPPRPASTRSRSAALARAPASSVRSRAQVHEVPEEEEDFHEDTNAGERAPAKPPYDGPKWLEHVPAHSPSVLGVGLMGLAVFLGILPFFASVGPFWSTVVVAGGLLLAARELRAAGQTNPAIDWVPEWLHPPALAAGFTVVSVALAVSMLGIGVTPVLWALGAGLVAHEQWRKVFDGPEGYQRLFEPRLLLKGTRLVAVVGVGICLLAMFLVWTRVGASSGLSASVPVPQGPPELRVLDAGRTQSLSADSLNVYGWDHPLAVFVELLLLGSLAVLALKPNPDPEQPHPSWVRFLPLGGAVLSLVWGLVHMKLQPGPIVFLGGLLGVAFVGVVQAIPPKAPEPEYSDDYGDGEYGDDYGGGEGYEGEGAYAQDGQYNDFNGDFGDPNGDFGQPPPKKGRGGGRG